MNIFDKIVEWMDRGEHSFVTFLSKIIPLLVPLIPAYVSYNHVVSELQFHYAFGLVYGTVVEGLGYASIYKAVQFWEWNRHYTKKENKLPLGAVISIYVAYLLVTLWVNVMLDWQSGVVWFRVVAVALISLLSVPAGLLLSISAVHTERTWQRTQAKNERRTNRPKTNVRHERTERTNGANGLDERRTIIYELLDEQYRTNGSVAGVSELARTIAVGTNGSEDGYERYKGYISDVRKAWKHERQIA